MPILVFFKALLVYKSNKFSLSDAKCSCRFIIEKYIYIYIFIIYNSFENTYSKRKSSCSSLKPCVFISFLSDLCLNL